MTGTAKEKLARLEDTLSAMRSVLVCYSGGVDSAFVLAVAHRVLGPRAVGMTAVSPSLAPDELEEAVRVAVQIGARHELVESSEIEDENYADLPADVYVRGFVTAYAKTIGLDPQAVVPSYMARLQDSRQKSQKSRFLGLR